MKSLMLGCLILSLTAAIAGCKPNTSNDDLKEKIRQDLADTDKEVQDAIDQANEEIKKIDESTKVGGQPGTIYLSESLVKMNAEGIVEPIPRIQIKQQGGKGFDDKVSEVKTKETLKVQVAGEPVRKSIDEVSQEQTYINIGCDKDKIDANETAGLKLEKMRLHKSFLEAVAQKIYICGKGKIRQNMAFLQADEVIFTDSDYEMNSDGVSLVIQARRLVLNGNNRLATVGPQSAASAYMPTASISLGILDGISGDGELELQSVGSSYSAAQKDRAKRK
ncbi:MAG: hypothetical protein ACXWC9_06770 [Pseudobdellovibrionaceae bacterium]